MEMFEKILLEMYGLTLLEYSFYILDAVIVIVCAIILFIGAVKYHRKMKSGNSKLLLLSFLGLFLSSIFSGIASEILFIDYEHLSFFQLFGVYLPTVFIVVLTVSIWKLLKEPKDV
jgi:hypothetical protein